MDKEKVLQFHSLGEELATWRENTKEKIHNKLMSVKVLEDLQLNTYLQEDLHGKRSEVHIILTMKVPSYNHTHSILVIYRRKKIFSKDE